MTKEEKINQKKELKAICITLVETRVSNALQAMNQAQEAANSEEKSSAGDKYETGRAMSQRERDMNAMQWKEANKELLFLKSIDIDKIYECAESGAIIKSNDHTYFIAVGIGSIIYNEQKVFVISAKAPLASLLIGKKKGEEFVFHEKRIKIETVY